MEEYSYEIINGIRCYNLEAALSNSFYPADVFDSLYSLEQSIFWFKSSNRLILYFFKKYIIPEKELETLEIGCGTGFFILKELKRIQSLKLYKPEVLLDILLNKMGKPKFIQ